MANLFDLGVSGLVSSQRVLATIGHNVANVNTPGYSRQRAELVARQPQLVGNGYLGKGVEVRTVQRNVDQFLVNQVRGATTNQSQAEAMHGLASQLSNLLANADTGFAPALQTFFDSVQDLADDPASIPARQVMLSGAETLTARLHDMSGRINDISRGVNDKLEGAVSEINALASSIARINYDIVVQQGKAAGQPPNDLLDQRDQMLARLSHLVGVTTVTQDDGAINVMIGNGQVLVAGTSAQRLSTVLNPFDASRTEVAYEMGGSSAIISDNLNSGELGGVLDFRSSMLDEARNALGRVATGLAQTFNAQHRAGMDLNGALGADFFSLPAPSVAAASGNAGTVSVAFDPAAVGALQIADYRLTHNGASFQLENLATGATQTLSGSGPFSVDGLTITVGTAPAAGDQYLIQPLRNVARDFALNVTDTRAIAAAAPVQTRAAPGNVSDARISAGQVLNAADANLLTTTTLVFSDPPTSFQVNGAGPLIPYTSGANIDVNGWRVQVSGTPAPGDEFIVRSNTGGVADNRNALSLGGLQTRDILDGGSATYHDAYAQMVGAVGSRTSQAEVAATALNVMLDSAVQAQQQVSGVNLDEEAANLMRFQQAYQASAQVIAAASSVFQTLLDAVRN